MPAVLVLRRAPLRLLAATLCAVLGLLITGPAAAFGDSNYGKPAFCQPRKPLVDFGFSGLPPVRELPADGKLPFAPPGVEISGYMQGQVRTEPGGFGFAFFEEEFSGPIRVDWAVSAQLWLLGGRGLPLREVGRKTIGIGAVDNERPPRIGIETLDRRGFYRFDIQFADRDTGAELGAYSAYLKLARPYWRASLRLDRHRYRPGQLVVMRLENLGTNWISYGESYVVQRLRGGEWVAAPGITPNIWAAWLGMSGPGAARCGALGLPANTPAGHYRIVKHVSVPISARRSRSHQLTAPFTVK